MTEVEMVGWHHRFNVHEFEQTPGDNEGQGSLSCCSSWGCKESDMTYELKNNREIKLMGPFKNSGNFWCRSSCQAYLGMGRKGVSCDSSATDYHCSCEHLVESLE